MESTIHSAPSYPGLKRPGSDVDHECRCSSAPPPPPTCPHGMDRGRLYFCGILKSDIPLCSRETTGIETDNTTLYAVFTFASKVALSVSFRLMYVTLVMLRETFYFRQILHC